MLTWKGKSIFFIAAVLFTLIFVATLFSREKLIYGSDIILQAIPSNSFAVSMIKNGSLPGWNPYLYSGMPFMDSISFPALFYPLNLLFLLCPFALAVSYSYIIHILLAGLFSYLFARALRIDSFGSLVAAIVFMFSGTFITLICPGHIGKITTIVWLPLIFCLFEIALRNKRLFYFIITGAVVGMQLLAGHYQIVYYSLLALSLYFLYRLIWIVKEGKNHREAFRLAAFFMAMIIVGLGLSAVQFLPNYLYISQHSSRAGGMGWDHATFWSFHPKETITFLVPEFFGLKEETYWGNFFFCLSSFYMGIFPLFLVAVALVFRRDRLIWFFTGLAILSYLAGLGIYAPFFYKFLYNFVPGFNKLRSPSSIYILLSFSVAILAGFGTNFLFGYSWKDNHKMRLRMARFTKVLVGISLILIIIGLSSYFGRAPLYESINSHLLSKGPLEETLFMGRFNMALKGTHKMIVFFTISTLLVWLRFKRRINLNLLKGAIVSVLLIDLWLVDSKFIKTVSHKEYYAKDEAVKFLEKDDDLYRILPVKELASSNWWMFHKIPSVGGYHGAAIKWYDEIVEKRYPNYSNFTDLLNVKYFLSKESLDSPRLELVLDGDIKIYRNRGALPRAWVVYKTKVMRPEEILEEMIKPTFRPGECAILEEEPEVRLPDEPLYPPQAQLWIDHSPNEILLEAKVDNDCFLVLSEIYYPAWKAYRNGKRTKIYKTNYILRSIYLPRGEHTVRFVYDGLAFKLGAGVSIFTFFFLVVTLIHKGRIFQKFRQSYSR